MHDWQTGMAEALGCVSLGVETDQELVSSLVDAAFTCITHNDANIVASMRRGEWMPGTELAQRGYALEFAALSVPGAKVRARVDLVAHKVWVDGEMVVALARSLSLSWGKTCSEEVALQAILAHELFHVLQPEAQGRTAEAAAHLFVWRWLGWVLG